VGEVDYW
jgi:hypothetical protein